MATEMTPDEFRAAGHVLVDWMADYLRDVGSYRVVPDVRPGDLRRRLPAEAPREGEPIERLVADFRALVLPGITHWGHPGFLAYFPANTSPPSILAEMLTAALGAQCMSWQTSPAATELEQVVMEWLRKLVGLPEGFTGVIQDTASTASLVALVSARERATAFAAAREGLAAAGRPLAAYASAERHSSIDKAVRLAGFGQEMLRLVPVDEAFALRPDALERLVAEDVARGVVPACIVATVGTTGSTAVDPLPAIGAIARRHGAWLHVDAAYAGSAAILPERRWILDGIAAADSLVFNPHKWLLTNFDCTAYFVRDVPLLLRAFGASPEYLRTTHDADVANFRDWGVQLGRRFRALKLWWVLRSYGVEGLEAHLRRHVALAADLAARVAADRRFVLAAPVHFGLVCLRLAPRPGEGAESADARTKALLERVNATGRLFLTHTALAGRYVIRVAIGGRLTGPEHVDLAWQLLQEGADG